MLKRAIGALRLDEQTYSDIAANPAATREALVILLIHIVVGALSFQFLVSPPSSVPIPFVPVMNSVLGITLNNILYWPLWVAVIYFVAIRLPGGTATYTALFRAVVFAGLPYVLYGALMAAVVAIFAPSGAIGILIGTVTGLVILWWILATLKAVRIATGVSTGRALLASALGNAVVTGTIGFALALVGLASVS